MAAHVLHPDTLEHGLSDGCPECRRKAKDPIAYLDGEHVADLWSRMVRVEHGMNDNLAAKYRDVQAYRSGAEADACRHLRTIALFLERHTSISPWQWPVK